MRLLRTLLALVAAVVLFPQAALAQLGTVPYTFAPDTTIRSAEVNANFTFIHDNALLRTGGTMTGTLSARAINPSAANTYDLGTAALPWQSLYLRTSAILVQASGNYTLTWANPAAARAISIADPGGTDVFTFNAATQTLTNKTLTAPVLGGTVTGTYTLGGSGTWGGNAIGATVGGTGLTAVGSNGQVLTVVTGAPAWATPAGMTLACPVVEGTDATAAATNVATCAISGLTVKDSLRVIIRHSSTANSTNAPILYNSTDSVTVLDNLGGALAADTGGAATVDIYPDQTAATTVAAHGINATPQALTGNSGVGAVRFTISTFTTAWTGSWTLALRTGAGGVNAGGTYHYRIAVYKVAGQ
jgi:hypothetical protein